MNLKELISMGKVKYIITIGNVLNSLNTALIAFFMRTEKRFKGIERIIL